MVDKEIVNQRMSFFEDMKKQWHSQIKLESCVVLYVKILDIVWIARKKYNLKIFEEIIYHSLARKLQTSSCK
jgi:hypothetical protein